MPLYSQSSGGSSTIETFTWTTKPLASSYSGKVIFISDVGINGSLWFSDGSKWSHDGPIIYQLDAIGWISPSLAAANAATYTQTGTTITVTSTGHNLGTLANGFQVYLNIASGAASAGWYSDFTYVDANTFTCTSTISQSTSGTINTNTAANIITPITKTILGGLLGLNGAMRIAVHSTNMNDAGTKTMTLKIGGATYFNNTITTGVGFFVNSRLIQNRNNESKQITQATGSYTGGANVGRAGIALNTANDFDHTVTLTCAAANEYVRVESILIEILPS